MLCVEGSKEKKEGRRERGKEGEREGGRMKERKEREIQKGR